MRQNTSLTVRRLQREELVDAAGLVGRGMSDNPANVRAFAMRSREYRSRALARFFVPVLQGLYLRGSILGAIGNGTLVGVCGIARPGLCQPAFLEKLRVLPALAFSNSPATPLRVLRWVGEWARRDPRESHWHLGPVVVDPHRQGHGIGTAMLRAFCAMVDDCRSLSYLETDKSENVRFYEKFGFTVVAEAEVLGVANWFMSRPGKRSQAEGPEIA
jgi:GNAT superfamily N-acetyltransferase